MKTLNEVIRAMEQCTGAYIDCDDCLYTQVNAEGVSICAHDDLDKDALHYLKEYREKHDDILRMEEAKWL